MTAYDSANNIIGSSSASNFGDIAAISTPGIARVEFTTTFQYGIDDLTFNAPAVPEPATMAVFGLMAAGAGAYVRRRKVQA
jgi:hypothetical protein